MKYFDELLKAVEQSSLPETEKKNVDRTIWQLNWSVPGKLCNTGLVTILILATKSVWQVLPVLVGLICVKVYSCVRLHRLPPPER